MNWTSDMAQAFIPWRRNNLRAHSRSIELCFQTPEVMEEFQQWYAMQRILGLRKIKEENRDA